MPNVNLFSKVLGVLFFFSLSTCILGQVNLELSNSSFEFPYLDKGSFVRSNQLLLVANSTNPKDQRSYLVKMSIIGNGIELSSTNQQEISFNFSGAPTRVFNTLELAKYFDINSLDLKGISKNQYLENGLPEGSYELCFSVYDVTIDAYSQVSNNACATYWVTSQLPPKIIYPKDNSIVSDSELRSIDWIAQHSTFSQIEYEVSVFEKFESVENYELLQYYKPIWTGVSFMETFNSNDLGSYLEDGQSYVVFVKARGITNHINFKNNGYGEPIEFKYKAPLSKKLKANTPGSCLPSSAVFINEISQGPVGTVKEFIELVVVGGDSESDLVDLSGFIIDDNNYDSADVGNESGHIRLGDCFSAVPRGTIILLYDDFNIHPGISRSNNSQTPNAQGVIQIPLSSPCITKYAHCPNMFQDQLNYNCEGGGELYRAWEQLIPLNNLHDVAQIRNTGQELEHAILWGTSDYEFNGSGKTIDFTSNDNISNKSIAMLYGEDWFDVSNFEIQDFAIATPGEPNSGDNEQLINTISEYNVNESSFFIECNVEFLPTTTAIKIEIHDDPITTYDLHINGEYVKMITGSVYRILDVEEGMYTIELVNKLTGCSDVCVTEVSFECFAGTPCDDFNNCTVNDVLTEDCKCVGEPTQEVIFTKEKIYSTVCNYCTLLFPWGTEVIENLNIQSIELKDPEGNLIVLDASLNSESSKTGFNFPYCIGTKGSCVEDDGWNKINGALQEWIDNSKYKGRVTTGICYNNRGLSIENSNLEFLTINSASNLEDSYSFEFEKTNCIPQTVVIGTEVTASVECNGEYTVEWSDGSNDNPITILGNPSACYAVTVTCEDDITGLTCTFEDVLGKGCDCIIGAPCEPLDPSLCYLEAFYDADCNCEIIEGFDTDGDGICDDEDICHGHDDTLDDDGDGVPDGCDICHGYDDNLEELQNDNEGDDPPCGEFPCPTNVAIEFEKITNGNQSCDYCLDLSDLPDGLEYSIYAKKLNALYDNEELEVGFLENWSEIHFENFDDNLSLWYQVGSVATPYNDTIYANSGTYSMKMHNAGAIQLSNLAVFDLVKSCQLRVEMSFISEDLQNNSDRIRFEYTNENGNFVIAKSWALGHDFEDGVRQNVTFFIDGDFSAQTNFRVRTFTGNSGAFFVDDIRVQKLERSEEANHCLEMVGDIENLAQYIDNWILEMGATHGGVEVSPNGSNGCGNGPSIYISNTTAGLKNLLIEGGSTNIQIDFDSPNCGELYPGDYNYELSAGINCDAIGYEWSNGETTQMINVPVLASYEVTVTCSNGCTYTSVFTDPQQECEFGAVCDGNASGNCEGTYDENCDCIVTSGTDWDGDGIPNCIDPCPELGIHDANENGILDCEECQCFNEPELVYEIIEEEQCSLEMNLASAAGFDLNSFEIRPNPDAPSITINSTNNEEWGFHFPYEYDVICHDPNDNSNWNDYGLNHFFADLYSWLPVNKDNTPGNEITFDLMLNPDDICLSTISDIKVEGMLKNAMLKFYFANGSITGFSNRCEDVESGYNVSLDINNCSACSSGEVQYLWSDGSTSETPNYPLNSLDQGYSVTIRCEAECIYEIYPDWEPDCIIGSPCDDGNPCTTNDQFVLMNEFDLNCFCQGSVPESLDHDSDGDGVLNDCDICEGFDDNLDTDYDGVPNGCDECEGHHDGLLYDSDPNNDPSECTECDLDDYTTIYTSRTRIPLNLCDGKPIRISGIDLIIPEYGPEYISYNNLSAGILDFEYCIGNVNECPVGSTSFLEFGNDLQSWLSHFGFSGNVNITINGLTGISITISDSEVEFVSINTSCYGSGGSRSFSSGIPFEVREDMVNITSGGACDDGFECTMFDVYDENCRCKGTYVDSDEDTVCDPLDECPNWPDYIGCLDIVQCLDDTLAEMDIHICEFLTTLHGVSQKSNNIVGNPKVIQRSISEMHCVLNAFINDPDFTGENFNIPGLIEQTDSDGDGIIDLLDIYTYDSTMPASDYYTASDLSYTGDCYEVFNSSGYIITAARNAALFMKSFMFEVVNSNYEVNPSNPGCIGPQVNCGTVPSSDYTPGCADELNVEVHEDADCVLRESSSGCAIYFYIDCEGQCQYYTTGDIDGNGVCGNELIVTGCETECPLENECEVVMLNPETCECETIATYDEDGDGVCDSEDECPGSDDAIDVDQDGIPDGCDDCPAGNVGDPCDDGNPCTFADHVIEDASGNCHCQGQIIDLDDDGIYDCEECDAAIDNDGDGYADEIEYDTFTYTHLDGTIEEVIACDVCPDLDDTIDANNDGLPDCIAPPFYDIGCPDDIQVVPGEGLLLTFPSDNITQDQLPQPIDLTYIIGGGAGNQPVSETYILYDYVRETDGVFEVFYSLPTVPDPTGGFSYLAVGYADHQPCVLNNDDPMSELNCPDNLIFQSDSNSEWLQIDFSLPSGYSYDIMSIEGNIVFNPPIGTDGIDTIAIQTNFVESPSPDALSINFFGIDGISNIGNYNGTITLPNGTECSISGGSTEPDCQDADGNDVTEGDPCDDDNDCTHHDKWIDNGNECECIGEDKPDTDNDGVCDEFDECTGDPDDPSDDEATMNDPDTGLCPCPDLVLSPIGLVNGNDFEIELDMSIADQFSNLSVSVTGGPEDEVINMEFSSPLVIPNLAYGYTYAIVITGECASGGTTVATAAIDVPFGEDQFFCGISLEPETVGSVTLLPQLNVGDIITAADFEVNVRKSSGSYGKFTGKGYISIPYLNFVRINVSFKDITVASNLQMIGGCINVDGYGVAILGDDISDAINDAVNDILNVLEDLSDILEDLIPMLEDIEELVETTGDLVSEGAKTCIEDAKADLLVLQGIAEGPSPPEDIVDQIKAATVVLEQCHQAYQAELEQILNDLNFIITETLNVMIGQCNDPMVFGNWQSEWDTNSYQDFITDFTAKMTTMLDEFPVSNDPEKGLGDNVYDLGFEQQTEEEYDFTDLPTDLLNDSEVYYTTESNYQFCYVLDKYESATNGFSGLDVAKFFIKAFLEIGTELVDDVATRLDQGETKEEIAADPVFQNTFKTTFQEVLRYESYQNK